MTPTSVASLARLAPAGFQLALVFVATFINYLDRAVFSIARRNSH
jgi:hypothetical protein